MGRKGLRILGLCAALGLGLSFLSCGHEQKLVSISVTPANVTITGAGLQIQYTATGHYAHPPELKDLTQKVVWSTPATQIISFSTTQPGLATSGLGCGTGLLIVATLFSNPSNPQAGTEIVGSTTVNVNQPKGTNPNCP